MAELTKPRVKVNNSAKKDEVLEVKTLISHPMENGQRRDNAGKPIPQDLINLVVATFAGKEVFRAKLAAGTSSNPYVAFFFKATGSGDLVTTWTDDAGKSISDKQTITVS
ncbi:MAG TPA: thiosulfate oxidation carrier complex protein SoxZ [Hyphomicrobiaceae bacterium]|nr:thiosulfate oxidation carrier complex protein SoxZ [Hyphomicrobiaceae bacterium]